MYAQHLIQTEAMNRLATTIAELEPRVIHSLPTPPHIPSPPRPAMTPLNMPPTAPAQVVNVDDEYVPTGNPTSMGAEPEHLVRDRTQPTQDYHPGRNYYKIIP